MKGDGLADFGGGAGEWELGRGGEDNVGGREREGERERVRERGESDDAKVHFPIDDAQSRRSGRGRGCERLSGGRGGDGRGGEDVHKMEYIIIRSTWPTGRDGWE